MPKSKSAAAEFTAGIWRSRNKPLIVLPDQGRATRISTAHFGIEGRDRSWGPQAENFVRANEATFKALSLDVVFSTTSNEIELSLKPNGVIGAVPLKAPNTNLTAGGIIVEPRYGWRSFGSLLSSIGWSATPEILSGPLVPGSATEIPAWVIAGPVIAQLELLLQHSGPRFRETTQLRTSPRGQIQWNEYTSVNLPKGQLHTLPCRFSDLDADHQLRRYVKWSLERVGSDLAAIAGSDFLARQLLERVQSLMMKLSSIQPVAPDHRSLDAMQRAMSNQRKEIGSGFDAIRWILDERGLAGSSNLDGLSWRVPMHQLFEEWMETLVRHWARGFGGQVFSGRKFESLSPISWERGTDSVSSLIPDVVVQGANELYVFDAKYKGFLDEVDERRWVESSGELRDDHRADIHQVVAYSSLYHCENLTVVLVYPMRFQTWRDDRRRVLRKGVIAGPGRQIKVALLGVPVELRDGTLPHHIVEAWERLRPFGE